MPRGKIALLIPHFGGLGIVRAMATLGTGLAALGHETELLVGCVRKGPPFPLPEALRLVDLDWDGRRKPAATLVRYLEEERPPALFSATHEANVLALQAQAEAGVETRVVVSVRLHVSAHLQSQPSLLRSVGRGMAQHYPRAAGIVALCGDVAEDMVRLSGLPREAITVIPNAVDAEAIRRLAEAAADHPGFGEGLPVVLGAGRLMAQKDFPTLIRAFAAVRERRPAKLVILGEGPERPRLQRLIGDLGLSGDAALPGHAANPFPAMRAAAVFVLSSRYEGFANVLPEALACGTPVVSTDCPGGSAEVLADGRYGAVVPMGDPPALAAAIERTLDARPAAESLIARAREFAPEAIAERWLGLIGEGARPA